MGDVILTVCIVAYNQRKYIKQCLDSIVRQKTKYLYKVIISDDASTDGTSEICSEYAKNYSFITHVRHPVNIGASENFKYAHRQAKTLYVSHCDGDDYWHEDKLEKQVSFLEQNKDCSAVYSNAAVINEDGALHGIFNDEKIIPSKISIGCLLERSNFLNNSSMTYRCNVADHVLYDDKDLIDYRFHIYLASDAFLGYIKDSLVFYRRNAVGGQCLNMPSFVGQLVHEARIEGILRAKLNVAESSRLKANAWCGKLSCLIKGNKLHCTRHSEVASLIVNAKTMLVIVFFFSALFYRLQLYWKRLLMTNG